MNQTTILTSAYILDLILGDPKWLPHPIRGIGFMIERLEPIFRKIFKKEKLAGSIFSLFIISFVFAATYIAIKISYVINFYLYFFISIYFVYASISIKDLKTESMKIYNSLIHNDLESARKNLHFIVGRDTKNLDKKEVLRGTIETIAEAGVDGIISPLFYAAIGGPAMALTYKAVSTLDSMVGYKNSKYIEFGWFSAKLDDVLNYIPARISAVILPISSFLCGKNWLGSIKTILRDGRQNPSPNSGIPEAAVAGALGIELGGTNYYYSIPISKPIIGIRKNLLHERNIKDALKIVCVASFLSLIFCCWLRYIMSSKLL